jgi:hypothetical protein
VKRRRARPVTAPEDRGEGVEQRPDAPVMTSEEILRARDRRYWHLERGAAVKEREP